MKDMEPELYNGVTIQIYPGVPGRKPGHFVLSWPGHAPEEIQSTRYQAPYVLAEAREFVDSWIEQGYVMNGRVSDS